jgi:excisionase family DNA binding protein
MSVVVEVLLNGVPFPVELGDEQLAAIAAHLPASGEQEPWPQWLSVETAARYLDCSPERVRKLVARRQIPFAQEAKGCRVSFDRDDLDEWMCGKRNREAE